MIPPATVGKLQAQVPVGQRHETAKDIAISLMGNGLSAAATFAELRSKFEPDVTDRELQNIVSWVEGKSWKPSVNGSARPFSTPQPVKVVDPVEHLKWWLAGYTASEEVLVGLSPFKVPDSAKGHCQAFFELLYAESDCVNVVCAYEMRGEKAQPVGGGITRTAGQWAAHLLSNPVPASKAGVWVRPNPCQAVGSGGDGSICDSDITAFRYILIESDTLPINLQLAFYAKLPLHISSITLSGGKSAHALVRVDCPDKESYAKAVARIVEAIKPFGFDGGNKNPSRLSRLPGAHRTILAVGDGMQRLLWINPKPHSITEDELKKFELSLKIPVLEDRPMARLVKDSIARYEELWENRGKLGVPTGIADFDKHSGGLRDGQLTVIAAESGGGKSTVALNFANAALKAGMGVALFTLEMDRDEICDLLISINCGVNRNVFNTGQFTNGDMDKIAVGTRQLAGYPLWIEDQPTLTVDEIRERTLQLKREKNIRLAILDYIQIVSPKDPREPREQQVASITRAIRSLSKEVRIPFVVLSQLNDEGKVRESRVVAHEAHNVIMIEGVRENKPVLMRVVKGRRIGCGSYPLYFDPLLCRIASASKISDDDVPRSTYHDY